jgi:TonB family protein
MPFEITMSRCLRVLGLIAVLGCHRQPVVAAPNATTSCDSTVVAPRAGDRGPTYRACQVDRVAPIPSKRQIVYPPVMELAGINGEVHLQFVVDERGRVDSTTVRALMSTHRMFTAAARQSVLQWKTTGARRGGTSVRQLTTHAFCFRSLHENTTQAHCKTELARFGAPGVTIACLIPTRIVEHGSPHGTSYTDSTPSRLLPAKRCE